MSSRLAGALCFAALAAAVRLPFLLTGKIPFDSDEAVEGLMARHVLQGELPAFFWGQAFKGVPEVYLAAGAFALFGPTVAVLKSVTLALLSAFVGLHFALVDRIASRGVAAASALLLIAAPPALVFWSLDASAEYVVIMLLGTALLATCSTGAGRGPGVFELPASRSRLFAAGAVCGAGFWVHQLFIIYVLPLAVVLGRQTRMWQERSFGRPSRATQVLAVAAALYVALGVVAFLTGGFDAHIGPVSISARAPQKMLRIAAALAVLAAAVHAATAWPRQIVRATAARLLPSLAGFAVGYAPALLYSVLVEPARSPARSANLAQLAAAAHDIFGNIVPILAGFKIATRERLDVPALAALPAAAALAAFLWHRRGNWPGDVFALFVVFVPILFLASGAYLDTQSYRYLIPWYAGLSVAWAAGSFVLAGRRRAIALALVGAIAGVHLWQQALWYRKLQPDEASRALIECLHRRGIRGGFAEYWTAYKLTFLSGESIVIAPVDGVDRYPPYTSYVRALPPESRTDSAARCE